MADPVYTFAVEYVTGSFTDISTLVERASWGQTLVDMFNPPQVGRAMFELANDSGLVGPRITSAAQPGRNIKLTATYNGSTYPLFRGRITDISLASQLGEHTTLVEAVDDWDRLQDVKFTTRLYSETNVCSIFTELMSQSAVQSFQTDGMVDVSGYAWYHEHPAIPALHELVSAGNYLMVVDGNGTFALHNRNWSAFNVSSTFRFFTASYALAFRSSMSRDTVFNRVRITGDQRRLATDLCTIAFLPPETPATLPASSARGYWFDFRDPTAPGEVDVPVGSLITPVASGDWYTSINSDGTGTDMTSGCALNFTPYAASAVATFTNNTGSTVWITRAQVRGYPIRRVGPVSQSVDITSSQARYGLHAWEMTNRLLQWGDYVGSLTTHIASDRKDGMHTANSTLRGVFPTAFEQTVGAVISIVDPFSGPETTWRIRGTQHELNFTQGLVHDVIYDLDTPQSQYGWGTPDFIVTNAFDPSAKSVQITLSNGNLTATRTGTDGNRMAKALNFVSTGKKYCEFLIVANNSTIVEVGIVTVGAGVDAFIGGDATGYGYVGGGQKAHAGFSPGYGASFTAGDVISMLFDAGAGTLTFWKNGATQGQAFSGIVGSWAIAMNSASGGADAVTLVPSGFTYTPPAGYVNWG